jgi:hypothetical protein
LYNSFPSTNKVLKSNAPSFDVKASMIVCLFSKAKRFDLNPSPYKEQR